MNWTFSVVTWKTAVCCSANKVQWSTPRWFIDNSHKHNKENDMCYSCIVVLGIHGLTPVARLRCQHHKTFCSHLVSMSAFLWRSLLILHLKTQTALSTTKFEGNLPTSNFENSTTGASINQDARAAQPSHSVALPRT